MMPTTSGPKKLIVVSAPSGAGKTTLCARLLKDFPEMRLSISSTTRAPRGDEKHGVAYFFMSREEFESGIQDGDFAEWALVHGNYYGTSKRVLEESFKAGIPVLLDIDVQGAESLRRAFPTETLTVFISPPNVEVLEQRLRARGTDSESSIARRMGNARKEMAEMDKFDVVVINDDFDRAYAELRVQVAQALGKPAGGRA
jgi:guanylate kinase